MKDVKLFIGNCGQWLCVGLLTFSILYELSHKADIGYIGITVSAFLFALFTKVKYYKRRS